MKAIYLGPKSIKKVWHNYGEDADGTVFEFTRGIPTEVPDSLANFLNSAPNFRLDDGTVFVSDPMLKVMHDDGRPITILLIRYLGGIGDILMVTPCIRGVREKFPNAEITFAINKDYFHGTLYEVIEHNPHIDKIRNTVGLSIHDKKVYSSWVDLSHPCARYESQTAPKVDLHRSEIYCDECMVSPSSMKPEIYLTPEDEEAAMTFFSEHNLYNENVIAIQPFAADLRRTWGVDRMFEVVSSMHNCIFLWVDYNERLPNNSPANIIDIGKIKIRHLAAVIKRCKAIIGNDSFMLQLGGALDIPTVAIFGATNPHMRCKFHKYYYTVWNEESCKHVPCWYGYPCLDHRLQDLGNLVVIEEDKHILSNRKCIESISVNQVINALQLAIKKERMPYAGQKVRSQFSS